MVHAKVGSNLLGRCLGSNVLLTILRLQKLVKVEIARNLCISASIVKLCFCLLIVEYQNFFILVEHLLQPDGSTRHRSDSNKSDFQAGFLQHHSSNSQQPAG